MAITPTYQQLIRISACLAAARYRRLEELIRESKGMRVGASKVYEIILQAYLFLGYPKAIEGLKRLAEVYPKHRARAPVIANYGRHRQWLKRGQALCRRVYGANYHKLLVAMRAISPELAEWMVVEGYGKVLSRGGLPGKMRELCTVAGLVVTNDPIQLHSHLRGARNLGATRTEILQALTLAGEFCGRTRLTSARKLCRQVLQR